MVVTSGWKGDLDDRSLAPGDVSEFKIEFDDDAMTEPDEYAIEIGFASGCSVNFGAPAPDPTPTPTPTPTPVPVPTPEDLPDGSGATVPSGLERNVLDRFDGYSYRTNEGTDVWLGGWQELNDDGAANDGNVYAVGNDGSVRLHIGEERAQETTWEAEHGASRKVDLSGASAAWLSFEYKRISFRGDDHVLIEVSMDEGETWTAVGRIGDVYYDEEWQTAAFDISDFASPATAIRFRSNFTNDDYFDYMLVDNVGIAFNADDPVSDWASGERYPSVVGAEQLHSSNLTGDGVTVAVIDSGYWKHPAMDRTANGDWRILAQYDAIHDVVDSVGGSVTTEENGHGTHVTSLIVNAEQTEDLKYLGVAPNAKLVSVKAFNGRWLRNLPRRDPCPRLGGPEQGHLRHSGDQLFVLGAGAVPLLGGPAQPGDHGRMAGRHRGRRLGRQHRTRPDDRRCARKLPLRHHRRRHVGQLHARRQQRRLPELVFRHRTHLRRLSSIPTWSPRPVMCGV